MPKEILSQIIFLISQHARKVADKFQSFEILKGSGSDLTRIVPTGMKYSVETQIL
jgi:hypothetical protein